MLLAATAAGTSAVHAAPVPVTAAEDFSGDFAKVQVDLEAGRFVPALKRLDRILKSRTAQQPELRAVLLAMRAVLLGGLDRRAEAEAAMAEAETLGPGLEIVPITRLSIAVMLQDIDRAVAAIRKLAAEHPKAMADMDTDTGLWAIRALNERKRSAEADRVALVLVRTDFAVNNLDTRSWLEVSAIRALMAAGDNGPAAAIALSLENAPALVTLLTDRRYAPLWEPVEAQLKPGLSNIHARAIEAAERFAAASPNSPQARLSQFTAYMEAGRIAEAEALAAKTGATAEAMAALDEQGGWLVNNHALLLRDLGKGTEAEARFAAMRAITIGDKPWLINMVINRLSDLVQSGNWTRALALDTEAGTLAAEYGSPYAQQLVRTYSLCARHRGQSGGDTTALLATVKDKSADAPLATMDAMICIGQLDAAETLLVEALGSEQWRDSAIETMQPAAARAVPANPTVWDQGRETLEKRPAVQAAFGKVGRILPERFWPAARGKE